MVDTPIAMAVARLAQATASKVTVRGARSLQFSDMKSDAETSLYWAVREPTLGRIFTNDLHRFQVRVRSPTTGKEVIRNVHPRPRRARIVCCDSAWGGATGQSYAIVAFLKNLDESGQVLFIAGQTAEGTEAAGKLVTDLPRLDATLKKCGVRASGSEHFEVLFRLNALAGSSSSVDPVNCRAF